MHSTRQAGKEHSGACEKKSHSADDTTPCTTRGKVADNKVCEETRTSSPVSAKKKSLGRQHDTGHPPWPPSSMLSLMVLTSARGCEKKVPSCARQSSPNDNIEHRGSRGGSANSAHIWRRDFFFADTGTPWGGVSGLQRARSHTTASGSGIIRYWQGLCFAMKNQALGIVPSLRKGRPRTTTPQLARCDFAKSSQVASE